MGRGEVLNVHSLFQQIEFNIYLLLYLLMKENAVMDDTLDVYFGICQAVLKARGSRNWAD